MYTFYIDNLDYYRAVSQHFVLFYWAIYKSPRDNFDHSQFPPVFCMHLTSLCQPLHKGMTLIGGSVVRNPPAVQAMRVQSLGQEDPLEKEMATHSSILA